ncbi:dual specificity protein phosphatase 4 isoform X1 [Callorhinchus milii]|uniref:Dual specificity protein phosphatase n=2 Tax=Callorhinchus milii TaxID=7868 RepID=A0A4W3J5G1_CALMI|nr:dual specificity protein phosphatase 4 isoform X1 [Callorhinchus milii]|eukprot:gi/632949355/ref/XP_007890110.1/ PREDICTED: dual specificity protein phosphatase 4 [Callorhinchus milii]
MEVSDAECKLVKRLLREDGHKCLLLDCRSFLAYSARHIAGAINVRCNTIVRRRAKGAVSLQHILPAEEPRSRLLAGLYSALVLYDERSQRLELVHPDSTVRTALGALWGGAHPPPTRLHFLKGGFETFSSEYPEFCVKTKCPPGVLSPSKPESPELSWSFCSTPLHDQGIPVEILHFLYLGSAYHASKKDTLDALGITALLNVSSDCPNHFEDHYQYKCIPVEDNHKADISLWFMEAIEYIDSVKKVNGRVLVHCHAGISRSATICLAYLMMTKRVRLDEAFEFVKQRRSIISPNFSFMGQLLQFESQILTSSCAVEAISPLGGLRDPSKSSSTPTSQFVFSFPMSVGVHSTPSTLGYLPSPITTSPTY